MWRRWRCSDDAIVRNGQANNKPETSCSLYNSISSTNVLEDTKSPFPKSARLLLDCGNQHIYKCRREESMGSEGWWLSARDLCMYTIGPFLRSFASFTPSFFFFFFPLLLGVCACEWLFANPTNDLGYICNCNCNCNCNSRTLIYMHLGFAILHSTHVFKMYMYLLDSFPAQTPL
jgi:hypothetical protein